MCEFCTTNIDKRHEEMIIGNKPIYDGSLKTYLNQTVNNKISLWLDDIDDNLIFRNVFNYNGQSEKFGSIGRFDIKYCPWCGRKLHDDI